MKSFVHLPALALLAATIFLAGCSKKPIAASSAVTAANPESAKTFEATAVHLDAGGDLYLYLRTEQILATLPAAMDQWKASLVAAAGKDLPLPPAQIDAWYGVGRKAVVDTGITQLRAFGLSSVELEPGLSRMKSVVYTGELAERGLFWRLGGKEAPHAFAALDFLPATTAYAGFSDFDPEVLWAYLQQIVATIPDPAIKSQAESFPALAEGMLGLPLKDLFASLGSEWGLVVTADETKTMTIPTGKSQSVILPESAAALVVEVNDDKLYDLLRSKLEASIGQMMPLQKSDVNGLRTVVVPMPKGSYPLEPTLARFGRYLVLATTPGIAEQLARTGKTPPALLKDDAGFQRFARREKLEGNAFGYLSERGAGLLRTFQLESMKADMPPAMQAQFAKFYELFTQKFAFTITRVEKDAVTSTMYTSQGSKQIVAAVAAIPVAAIAAIAIPAVMKAQAKAAIPATPAPEATPAEEAPAEEPAAAPPVPPAE